MQEGRERWRDKLRRGWAVPEPGVSTSSTKVSLSGCGAGCSSSTGVPALPSELWHNPRHLHDVADVLELLREHRPQHVIQAIHELVPGFRLIENAYDVAENLFVVGSKAEFFMPR